MPELPDRLNTALAGRYVIQRELGAGGMATVFLAQDLRHRRRVAIKVLHAELAALLGLERFLREIEIAAGLTHPHILPLYDSGVADGILFYVMPYAEGESLRHRLAREKQLPLEDALRIARETADALDYSHRHGVVHRDIKPENILLIEQHAVVVDFGIARAITVAGGERLTATGTLIGTPAYMSPEQVIGNAELDGRSDQYSVACVLYEMLAGEPPFTGPTAESLAHQHLSVAPRPVRQLRTTVPAGVEDALGRALAKTAADRFGTAAEFAVAVAARTSPEGATPHPALAAAQGPVAGRQSRAPRSLIWGGAIAVVVLGAVVGWLRWHPDHPAPAEKHWILVADFEGPADDSSLAVTAREIVSAALDQSRFVATVPRDQIQLALEKAGTRPGTRLSAQLARELAYRSSVRTVVEGTIGRLGRGYFVVLRVEDVESPKVIITERATARNEDGLIPTLGHLAEKLRSRLGEKRSEIQAIRPVDPGTTSSFEAYRLYVRGRDLGRSLREREAIPVLRDALALDMDFAMAWRSLGVMFGNTGQLDSALAAFDQALKRPKRLTTMERLTIEADRAMVAGDPEASVQAYGRALQHDPASALILQNRGVALSLMGRFAEALEDTRAAQRMGPFAGYPLARRNEVRYLISLGRVDEARRIARDIQERGGGPHPVLIEVEIGAGRWAAAESLALVLLRKPGPASWILIDLASAQAARGAERSAAATFDRAEADARATGTLGVIQDLARRGRLMLSVVSEGAIPLPPDAWGPDSSTATVLTRGLRAAIAGDRPAAQRLLEIARARPPWDRARQGATFELLAARIEALAGRWSETAKILEPVASQPVEIGYRTRHVGMSAVRWTLADALERLGRPDSAASCLERIISDPAPTFDESHLRGIVIPFAHRRLVLLYARMGRLEDARRHWKAFSETMRTPDPEIQPLIEEAHDALRGVEGLALSTRR